MIYILVSVIAGFFLGYLFTFTKLYTRIAEEVISSSYEVMVVNFFDVNGERFFHDRFTRAYLGKCNAPNMITSVIKEKFPDVKEVIYIESKDTDD